MPDQTPVGMAISRARSELQGRLRDDSQRFNVGLTEIDVAVKDELFKERQRGIHEGEQIERRRMALSPKRRPIKEFVEDVVRELADRTIKFHRP